MKYNESEETFANRFCEGDKIKESLREVISIFVIIFSMNIQMDSQEMLLHLYTADVNMRTKKY